MRTFVVDRGRPAEQACANITTARTYAKAQANYTGRPMEILEIDEAAGLYTIRWVDPNRDKWPAKMCPFCGVGQRSLVLLKTGEVFCPSCSRTANKPRLPATAFEREGLEWKGNEADMEQIRASLEFKEKARQGLEAAKKSVAGRPIPSAAKERGDTSRRRGDNNNVVRKSAKENVEMSKGFAANALQIHLVWEQHFKQPLPGNRPFVQAAQDLIEKFGLEGAKEYILAVDTTRPFLEPEKALEPEAAEKFNVPVTSLTIGENETWADFFRRLHAMGWTTTQIAKETGKSYQQVRGTLVKK